MLALWGYFWWNLVSLLAVPIEIDLYVVESIELSLDIVQSVELDLYC